MSLNCNQILILDIYSYSYIWIIHIHNTFFISCHIRNIILCVCPPPPNGIHLLFYPMINVDRERNFSLMQVCLKLSRSDSNMINEIKTHIDLFFSSFYFVKTKVNKNVKQNLPTSLRNSSKFSLL